ncbi:hypothetical protein E3T23_01790 [Cryobacterium cheniae]|uniref:Uncharacterized protein n=1 Tax=Cryobacterium cheniae TaxID=1259262 RepID=A0A4R8XX46_9MICO|nr:hypothetical protein [Cryobacterium cheniae]TFC83717.1 hypothetical protein E3T23_01790 [Cryobacterium cheniae]
MNVLSLEQEFRKAWADAAGDSFSSRMARRSLEASAQQTPALEIVLFQLKNRYQAELDLHLNGTTVKDHQTNAADFANLVRGISDAVKEITKKAMGRQRMLSGLLVSAPVPGSVRVVLRAASPTELDGSIQGARVETLDSSSLRAVAAVLAHAGDASNVQSAVLEGLLTAIPVEARPGIRRVAKAVTASDWNVSGVLRLPNEKAVPLHLNKTGAEHLLSALNDMESETSVITLRGNVDGQRRSMGTMWFAPESAVAVEAVVVDHDLLEEVAALGASGELTSATFNVITQFPPGARSAAKRSYVLTAIKRISLKP